MFPFIYIIYNKVYKKRVIITRIEFWPLIPVLWLICAQLFIFLKIGVSCSGAHCCVHNCPANLVFWSPVRRDGCYSGVVSGLNATPMRGLFVPSGNRDVVAVIAGPDTVLAAAAGTFAGESVSEGVFFALEIECSEFGSVNLYEVDWINCQLGVFFELYHL